MAETRSTCPYCGVGCGVIIESEGDQITGVRGDPEHPANFGRLCSKGSTLHLTAAAPVTLHTRLLQPLRRAARGQAPQPVGWDAALDEAAARLASIAQAHGPDALGFYVSGQLLTEDYYVFNKLAKGLFGTNNIDTNSRLCMSSAVAGYKVTLGADAPPACYDDLALADCLFIAGSNTAFAHPILFRRIEEARRARPDLKIVVVDPRRTETADVADLHLQIQPGTDVALFHGMLHLLMWEGLTDARFIEAHTSGFAALRDRVREFTPKETARLCGIAEADLLTAARWFGASGATLSLYCQGLNQSSSGTAKNAALINLHLATGKIGKPGCGPFSLTGQPNAMGGREVGGLANLLSAHRDLANAADRAEVERLWGLDLEGHQVPAEPGKSAVEMFEAAADGQVKALWIACTNPAQSMPDQATVRRALQRAEFVVLQEAFANTATADFADLLLPASTWGEKNGTVTNSERRISRVRPAVARPGEARDDWRIVVDVAHRVEALLRPGRPTMFPYRTPEAVWSEHRESTRGRDLDITGLDYAMLEAAPQQWPLPEGQSQGRARLYEDGVFATPDGRAQFFDAPYQGVAEPRDARFPFSLTTGRLRDQWHGMSRTGTLGRLFGHVGEPSIELHPQELARLRVAEGDLLEIRSRRGRLLLPVQANDQVAPTQAFVAMHWGAEFVTGRGDADAALAGINALTNPAFCPRSKQPELKHTAVRLQKAELPWRVLALAWLPEGQALQAREHLRRLLPRLAYGSCTLFGREPQGRVGVLLRGADVAPADDALLAEIESHLGLGGREVLHYVDRKRGQRRTMRLSRDASQVRLEAFVLGGDISAQTWLRPLLQDELPAQAYGRLLMLPGAKAPVAVHSRGRQVCNCLDVVEPRIVEVLQTCSGTDDDRLLHLQQSLQCGTQCGSCVPELKRLVRTTASAAATGPELAKLA